MTKRLAELEQLVLMAVLRLGGTASGLDLAAEIKRRIGRVIQPGAIYTTMERLRDQNLVESFTGRATPERGGRRRKYYVLTAEGEEALSHSYQLIERMAHGFEEKLGKPVEDV